MFDSPAKSGNMHGLVVTHIYKFITANVSTSRPLTPWTHTPDSHAMEGELVEALPVDILSHDTVEAKLLQPAVNVNVTLYEDSALIVPGVEISQEAST